MPTLSRATTNALAYRKAGKTAAGTGCLAWYMAMASGIHFFSWSMRVSWLGCVDINSDGPLPPDICPIRSYRATDSRGS